MRHFDALILGGGTAGCVMAARLSEDDGREVCLVEAGPDYGPHDKGRWPGEMLDALVLPDTHDWTDDHGGLSVARILGGCSSHNFCIVALPQPEDCDDWGLPGWSGEDLAPHLDRVLETLPLRHFEEAELHPWFAGMREAAAELGLPFHEELNAPGATEGIGKLPLNVRGTARWNASFAYLDQARGRLNLTVLPETSVERIEIAAGRAGSVTVRSADGTTTLSAETVVLSAGAYNSPAVLLRSGIGPEEELRRHGIRLVEDLPVGVRLREHFGVPLRFAPSAEMTARIERHQESQPPFPFNGVIKARSSSCPPERWDLILSLALFPGPVLSSTVMLMRPEWTGQVTLRSADPADLPLVTELALDSDRDMAVACGGLELGRRLAATDALSALIDEETAPGPEATPESIRAGGREALSTYFHPVGTCPMGEGGVTEPDGRLHGIENLYLVDASILPEIPPVPTNVTVLAAAEKIAAGIRASS